MTERGTEQASTARVDGARPQDRRRPIREDAHRARAAGGRRHGPRGKAQGSSALRGEGEPGSGPTFLRFTREVRMGQKIPTFGHRSGSASNQPRCKKDAKTCDSVSYVRLSV